MSFFKDLFSGNFTAVIHDVNASIEKLPSWAQKLITTLETGEGQILSNLVSVAAQDVISGGLTTASFTAAAKDVESKLVAQNITLGRQVVFSALNAAVAEAAPTAIVPPAIQQPQG